MEETIVKPTFKERVTSAWSKTKAFVSTHKKQIIRGVLIGFGMVLGVAVFKEGQKEEEPVESAETVEPEETE